MNADKKIKHEKQELNELHEKIAIENRDKNKYETHEKDRKHEKNH
jgi:hypothetical protein